MLFPILLSIVRYVYISIISSSVHKYNIIPVRTVTKTFAFCTVSFRGLVPFINARDVKYLVLDK